MNLPKKLDPSELDRFILAHGAHRDRSNGLCPMEVVAWLVGEKHSDHPACVSPILGQFVRTWNDNLDEPGRQKLKPYLARLIGTAGDGHDELRGWLCADWLIRVYTPAWLDLAGVNDAATALRNLPELRNLEAMTSAQPTIKDARSKAFDAWDAGAAAEAAAMAAGAAARVAAMAAEDAAVAAARAARAAARAAARVAAKEKLQPTVVLLQESALQLLERLIDPSTEPPDEAPEPGSEG